MSPLNAQRSLAAVLVIALAACTGESSAPIAPAARAVTKSVEIADADAVLMVRTPSAPVGERGGTTLQLDAGVFGKKGKSYPNKHERFYEWLTTDPAVATVDSTGLVSAV